MHLTALFRNGSFLFAAPGRERECEGFTLPKSPPLDLPLALPLVQVPKLEVPDPQQKQSPLTLYHLPQIECLRPK